MLKQSEIALVNFKLQNDEISAVTFDSLRVKTKSPNDLAKNRCLMFTPLHFYSQFDMDCVI